MASQSPAAAAAAARTGADTGTEEEQGGGQPNNPTNETKKKPTTKTAFNSWQSVVKELLAPAVVTLPSAAGLCSAVKSAIASKEAASAAIGMIEQVISDLTKDTFGVVDCIDAYNQAVEGLNPNLQCNKSDFKENAKNLIDFLKVKSKEIAAASRSSQMTINACNAAVICVNGAFIAHNLYSVCQAKKTLCQFQKELDGIEKRRSDAKEWFLSVMDNQIYDDIERARLVNHFLLIMTKLKFEIELLRIKVHQCHNSAVTSLSWSSVTGISSMALSFFIPAANLMKAVMFASGALNTLTGLQHLGVIYESEKVEKELDKVLRLINKDQKDGEDKNGDDLPKFAPADASP